MKRHRWLSAAAVLIIVLGGAYAGACEYFYRVAFVPSSKSFLSSKMSKDERADRKWLASVRKEQWHEQAVGHAQWRLRADYVPAATATKQTVVVAHGYMNTKEDMASYIRMFHNAGYNVLAPDDRGHGQSDGNYIGYGWPDRKDYSQWIKQVVRRNGQTSRIALFGVSMGGATVMYTAGEHLPRQVRVIVEDCGYTSVADELSFQARSMYHLPAKPFVPSVLFVARLHTGVNYAAAKTSSTLKNNHLPTLFIHGAKDKFVPTAMARRNYNATAGSKQLWIVPGAAHAASQGTHPRAYQRHVLNYLAAHMH
ncbi:alpha/beta hydrolase [Lacticaseibacillus zhaodongensis]|uniref:alpha/beta hydrolase n=1 Tax=Lacticaseibacillus zhaodongensis TaxID=2668065 RepID=UPI00353075E5